MCRNLINHRFGFELEKLYHHYYFAPGGCILFLKPSDFPRRHRSAGFCSQLGHVSRSCASNLCKPVAIMFHCSTSLFRPFSYPPTSKCSVFMDLFLHLFSRQAPATATIVLTKILQYLHTRYVRNIFIVYFFILQGISKYLLQHSHFCSR